jgi:hypothetical protein
MTAKVDAYIPQCLRGRTSLSVIRSFRCQSTAHEAGSGTIRAAANYFETGCTPRVRSLQPELSSERATDDSVVSDLPITRDRPARAAEARAWLYAKLGRPLPGERAVPAAGGRTEPARVAAAQGPGAARGHSVVRPAREGR